ncbi:hypothetical protein BO79DRAFT_38296 [Aspergillus costaricaensis CBS 115574]|uniref:Uncharacterized protein n=1 Tax=Aspergillus costaricaensis CBS 115574 TaxID=1448317 RepID=A0ACD1I6D8_9EURO|nr:hypothetical protein BO79DRAFT_38296 [Aspergillus costaricaensis CBS 115574]RAK86069.1 hypothetical protein BO79DRAFT_38296 [Aspergillus costaricaensis CBS 115574]
MSSLNLVEVTFVNQLRKSPVSCIFRTVWHGRDSILKVYHSPQALPSKRRTRPRNRETDPFKCESSAYLRLREHGFCDRGHIPDFYGLIENINPVHHLPYLQDFVEDTVYPNAILMEYVPDIHSIDLSNYSERRLRKLQQILLEMHRAGVYHGDPYPRNMMVQITSDRVLWIDFDRAQTFTSQSIKQCHLTWLERETRMMEEFVEGLAADAKLGRIHETWICYYEGFRPPKDDGKGVLLNKEPGDYSHCVS